MHRAPMHWTRTKHLAYLGPSLSRHPGEVPPKGAEGEGHAYDPETFRSEIFERLDCGFPPPALRATSPVRASEGAETGEAWRERQGEHHDLAHPALQQVAADPRASAPQGNRTRDPRVSQTTPDQSRDPKP